LLVNFFVQRIIRLLLTESLSRITRSHYLSREVSFLPRLLRLLFLLDLLVLLMRLSESAGSLYTTGLGNRSPMNGLKLKNTKISVATIFLRHPCYDLSVNVHYLQPLTNRYLIYCMPQDKIDIRIHLVCQVW